MSSAAASTGRAAARVAAGPLLHVSKIFSTLCWNPQPLLCHRSDYMPVTSSKSLRNPTLQHKTCQSPVLPRLPRLPNTDARNLSNFPQPSVLRQSQDLANSGWHESSNNTPQQSIHFQGALLEISTTRGGGAMEQLRGRSTERGLPMTR